MIKHAAWPMAMLMLFFAWGAQAQPVPPSTDPPADRCGPAVAGATCEGGGPASLGNQSGTEEGAGNPINVINGNKYQREDDMPALPGVLGLELVRHYNSHFSGANQPAQAFGRGWRLSYQTSLHVIGATVQIVQADGGRIVFARAPGLRLCTSGDPRQGKLEIGSSGGREYYLWHWLDGRRLRFDEQGRLIEIRMPSGEFASLSYDRRGRLIQVVDPQRRSLLLRYGDSDDGGAVSHAAAGPDRVTRVDTPVGSFHYRYGGDRSTADDAGATGESLIEARLPDRHRRRYLHQDAAHPGLLTAIAMVGPMPGDASLTESVFAYDEEGRAIRSNGVSLRFERPALPGGQQGLTVLTNALGQTTRYRHAIIAGQSRLIEVLGAGCALCGRANVRYRYDTSARLIERLDLGSDAKPVSGMRWRRDRLGRVIGIESLAFDRSGRASAHMRMRLKYEGPIAAWPSEIIRPSVAAGLHATRRIERNGSGQPIRVVERGWIPDLQGRAAAEIVRHARLRYRPVNGRSLLVEVEWRAEASNRTDTNSPDSQARGAASRHRFEYDDRGDFRIAWIEPDGRTHRYDHDAAGRIARTEITDGDRRLLIDEEFDHRGARTVSVERARLLLPHAQIQEPDMAGEERRWSWRRDEFGRLSRMTDPQGRRFSIRWDERGRIASMTDAAGRAITLRYDAEGRVVAARRDDPRLPHPFELRFEFASSQPFGTAQLQRMVDEIGTIASREYDPLRFRLVGGLDARGVHSAFDYDEWGRVTAVSRRGTSDSADGMFERDTFTHDALGFMVAAQRVEFDSIDGKRREFAKATRAAASRVMAPSVATSSIVASHSVVHDDFGRKVIQAGNGSGVVLHAWDIADRWIGSLDSRGSLKRVERDVQGRPVSITLDSGSSVRLQWNGRRLAAIRSAIQSDGADPHRRPLEERRFRHDGWGRVIEERHWQGDETGAGYETVCRWTYQGSSQRILQRELVDGQGRVHRFQYGHDEQGELESIRFNGRVVVDRIRSAEPQVLVSLRHGNGMMELHRRDARVRTSAIELRRSADGSAERSNDAGSVASTEPVALMSLDYDSANRLMTQAAKLRVGKQAITWSNRFEYDSLGRLRSMRTGADGEPPIPRPRFRGWRMSDARTGSSDQASVLDRLQADRLIASFGDRGLGLTLALVDGSGSIQARVDRGGITRYWRDRSGRALRVSRSVAPGRARGSVGATIGAAVDESSSEGVRYRIGLFGERIERREGDRVRGYRHDGQGSMRRLSAELDANGAVLVHHVHLFGRPIARIDVDPLEDRSRLELDESRPRGQGWVGLFDRAIDFLRRGWPGIQSSRENGHSRIAAIHCDPRGVPFAVSDAQGRLTAWSRSDAFGRAMDGTPGEGAQGEDRLPHGMAGQTIDASTGLHDNQRRDFDPATGLFQSADPLLTRPGLPLAAGLRLAGMSSHAYADGDPVNFIDPGGLNQEDVHYYLTYFLALAAGLPDQTARVIASANRYIDDNPYTEPFGTLGMNFDARQDYHFTQAGFDPPRQPGESAEDYAARRIRDPSNPRLQELRNGALAASDPCVRAQLYGEYLHPFQDSFAHRDQDNDPYAYWLGHLLAGESPDYTYNHVLDGINVPGDPTTPMDIEWNVNEDRTMRMAFEVFEKLQRDFGARAVDGQGRPIRWEDVESAVRDFARSTLHEKDAAEKGEILERRLTLLGLPDTLIRYDCFQARGSRLQYLGSNVRTPSLDQRSGIRSSETCR